MTLTPSIGIDSAFARWPGPEGRGGLWPNAEPFVLSNCPTSVAGVTGLEMAPDDVVAETFEMICCDSTWFCG